MEEPMINFHQVTVRWLYNYTQFMDDLGKNMQFLGFENHFLKQKNTLSSHTSQPRNCSNKKIPQWLVDFPFGKSFATLLTKTVVEPPTPLKNDGVGSSVGMMTFPYGKS
jgi:hypothetical protein